MKKEFRNLKFSASSSFIIAEIGNNHEGNFDLALNLIKEAAETGVDAVKFQTFKTELYISKFEVARFDRLKSFEFSFEQFEKLRDYARMRGLFFLSTPFDFESLLFLEKIADGIKISSGDNNFFPLIEKAALMELPLIISSGLATQKNLELMMDKVSKLRTGLSESNFALLHCVTAYPVQDFEANLRAITTLRLAFKCRVGYSDHTLGVEACWAAVALGASVVEKHFTLSKTYSSFRDHQLSADPTEMRELVKGIRRIESMLGDGKKTVQSCEQPFLQSSRRGAYMRNTLEMGRKISNDDLLWLRPANDFSPECPTQLLNSQLNNTLSEGAPIKLGDLN